MIGLAALGIAFSHRVAVAETCIVQLPRQAVCANNGGGSIDDYIDCYRDYFDNTAIPAFTKMAQCSHVKAANGLQDALESLASQVTKAVQQQLNDIDAALNDPAGPVSFCATQFNEFEALLQPFLDDEQRHASDLEAFRRATYHPEQFRFFEGQLLNLRQNRAICGLPLESLKKKLRLLFDLKFNHPDYCQILRQSADYASVSKIEGLQMYTKFDTGIHFDQYFDFFVSWNPQCGYYDFSNPNQTTIRTTACPTLTLEYKQTLDGLDGTLGWLAKNRNAIVLGSTLISSTILAYAGAGSSAGPYGAVIGAAVGLIISGVEWLMLENKLDELNDLIADKEQELKNAIAANMITEDEFHDKITELCTPLQPVVEARIQDVLRNFDPQKHIDGIEQYFVQSDAVNDWYNALFLWATTPGPDGTTFIDEVTTQELLALKDTFDQDIFAARADQEAAAERTVLTNVKATVTQLSCSNLSPAQRRTVKQQMVLGIRTFNGKCTERMDVLAVSPDAPLAFADAAVTSDVVCKYAGFRNGVATLEVHNGDGAASNMVIKDATGTVLATIPDVSSDTDFSTISFPGFACASESFHPFGIDDASRLAEGTYPLLVHDNILGFDESDAAALRSAVQTLDSQLRLKVLSCTRQLGNPNFNLPRPADACGIPTNL